MLWPRPIGAACLLALAVGGVLWWHRGGEVYRVRDAAIRAIEQRDADALFALTDPFERQAVHLTPEAVRQLLGQTLWTHGPLKAVAVREFILQPEQDRMDWVVVWGGQDGKPIHVDFGEPPEFDVTHRRELPAVISLHRGSRGWRLNFTHVIWCYVGSRWYSRPDRADVTQRYIDLTSRAGLDGVTDEYMEHASVTTLARNIRFALSRDGRGP